MEEFEIEKLVMDRVKEKEKFKYYLGRCLDALVCPKCGEDLKRINGLDENTFICKDYECTNPNCGFARRVYD